MQRSVGSLPAFAHRCNIGHLVETIELNPFPARKAIAMNMTPGKAGLLTIILVFMYLSLMINSEPHGWLAWYHMASSGQKTQATITRVQPEMHRRCDFEYQVDARRHEGFGDGCSDSGIGQAISITYLPTDPSFSTTRDPMREFAFRLFAPFIMSLLAGIISAWRVATKRRK